MSDVPPLVWVRPDALFDGQTVSRGVVALRGRVVEQVAAEPPACARVRPVLGTLTMGFIDLQVNGGGDVLFNTDPTPEGIAAIVAAHRRFGTVGLLPTVITDAPEVMQKAARAVLAARDQVGVLGIHIEGPHISVARRGTHDEAYVRPMDRATIDLVASLRAEGLPVMITLAPENASADQISELAATGAVVSLGHTNATAEDTKAALAAGAGCFTHLFNAMSPMLNRSPGVTGAALNSRAYAGIICDGVHVADDVIAIALRARPAKDLTFLVSDAMPTVGGSDSFQLYDMHLTLSDGRLLNDQGSLAGAHVTLAESVRRLITVLGVDPAEALRMATTVPARVVGRDDLCTLTGRRAEDLLILDPAWKVTGTLAAALA